MHYYKEDDKTIYKYDVYFDRKKVTKLLDEVIERCSIISYQEVEATKVFNPNTDIKNARIKNLTTEKIRQIDYNDFYSLPEDLYRFTFYKYEYTRLANLIIALLNGDASVIDEIFNPVSISNPNFDEKLSILYKQLSLEENHNTKSLEKIYKEIKMINELKNQNINQVSDSSYYIRLQNMIHINLESTLDKDIKDKYDKFYGIKLTKKM